MDFEFEANTVVIVLLHLFRVAFLFIFVSFTAWPRIRVSHDAVAAGLVRRYLF
jgi:hypothetical protein